MSKENTSHDEMEPLNEQELNQTSSKETIAPIQEEINTVEENLNEPRQETIEPVVDIEEPQKKNDISENEMEPPNEQELNQTLSKETEAPIQEEVIQQPVTQQVVDVDPNQFEFDFSEPGKVDKLIELAEKQARGIDSVNDSLKELIKLQQLLIKSNKVKLTSNGSRPKNNKS